MYHECSNFARLRSARARVRFGTCQRWPEISLRRTIPRHAPTRRELAGRTSDKPEIRSHIGAAISESTLETVNASANYNRFVRKTRDINAPKVRREPLLALATSLLIRTLQSWIISPPFWAISFRSETRRAKFRKIFIRIHWILVI